MNIATTFFLLFFSVINYCALTNIALCVSYRIVSCRVSYRIVEWHYTVLCSCLLATSYQYGMLLLKVE